MTGAPRAVVTVMAVEATLGDHLYTASFYGEHAEELAARFASGWPAGWVTDVAGAHDLTWTYSS